MNEILPLLTDLANTLGTSVEMLWGVLIKQAILSAIISPVILAAVIYAVIYFAKNTLSLEVVKDDEEWQLLIYCILFVISIPLTIFGVSVIYNFFTGLINPEYIALQKILNILN
jgi:hypothetical protein